MTIEPDQLIDSRYKVTEHLGQGGMGTVWKAVDQQAGGDVVIKMPLDGSNPVILQRFGNEAMMMRQHSTGNNSILDIQGLGDIDGIPYYVMRFLSGGSLEDRCPIVDEQGQPDFRPESFEWLTTIAKALDFLHSKDVLHRDVKPGNIMFNESGDAYLVDFGIVKSPLEASSFTSAPTAANTSPGTIEYMPPEVLAGEVDAISGLGDQYALAVTLYEMIAGKRPFTGPTETAISRAIETGAKSLAEVKPGIPTSAAAVVARALNSDPSKRFKTCREFATAFDSALSSQSVSSPVSVGPKENPSEAQTGMVPIGGSEGATPIHGGVSVPEQPGGGSGFSIADSFQPAVPAEGNSLETGPNVQRLVTGKRIWLGVVAFAGIIGMSLYFAGTFGPAPDITSSNDAKTTESNVDEPSQPLDVSPGSAKLTAPFGPIEIQTALDRLDREEGLKPEITNSLGMQFRLIPAGTFTMGSPSDETDRDDDELQHEVRISKGFYLGVTEVTQEQWRAVMETEPWQGKDFVKEGDRYAATFVNWEDAMKFCEKLSVRDGVEYRLPTEAEWEYACRGGSSQKYSFGNTSPDLGKYAWFEDNADKVGEHYAHEVGLKLGNDFRLHDMHGNVWEWCSDNYGEDYYGASDLTDPEGPDNDDISRVGRGGAWNYSAQQCRSATRGSVASDYRDRDVGFRVLRNSSK